MLLLCHNVGCFQDLCVFIFQVSEQMQVFSFHLVVIVIDMGHTHTQNKEVRPFPRGSEFIKTVIV